MATHANTTVTEDKQATADDTLFNIGSDLEGSIGKLECLSALIGRMADDEAAGQDALILFHFLYSLQDLHREQQAIFLFFSSMSVRKLSTAHSQISPTQCQISTACCQRLVEV